MGQAAKKSAPSKPLDIGDSDGAFLQQVAQNVGIKPCVCRACRHCSARCPMFEYMDYGPHGIIRLVLLGFKKEAITSSTIWRCLGCQTCAMGCPMAINSSLLMEYLRQKCQEENTWGEFGC